MCVQCICGHLLYVCMHVRVCHICVCAYMYVHACVWMYVCVCVCAHNQEGKDTTKGHASSPNHVPRESVRLSASLEALQVKRGKIAHEMGLQCSTHTNNTPVTSEVRLANMHTLHYYNYMCTVCASSRGTCTY